MTPIFHPLRDALTSRSAAEILREEQAFYEKHAHDHSPVGVIGWLAAIALLVVLVVLAVPKSSYGDDHPARAPLAGAAAPGDASALRADRYQLAGSPLTVFIDGPTGFVFVYTEDGWKFVRGSGDRKP